MITGSTEAQIKEEPEDPSETLYGAYSKRKNPKYTDCSPSQRYDQSSSYPKRRGRNPLDIYGNVTRCSICDSINHYQKYCPDRDINTYHQELEMMRN